jgi:hypothetical protein
MRETTTVKAFGETDRFCANRDFVTECYWFAVVWRSGLLTNIEYRPNAVAEIYRGKEVFGAVVRFYWKERRSRLFAQSAIG